MAADPPTSTFDPVASRVRVEVEAADELQKWLDKAGKGDFVVRLLDRLDENVQVEVVVAAGELEFPMRCKVKQVFRSGRDRYGTMVEWLDRQGAAQAEVAEESLEGRVEMASGAFDVPIDSPTPSGELPRQSAPENAGAGLGGGSAASGGPATQDSKGEESTGAQPSAAKLSSAAPRDPSAARPASESSTGVPKLTRKLPKATDDHSRLFDISALNPDLDESKGEASGRASSKADRVAEADRHAEELEALLSESGRWSLDEIGLAGTTTDPPSGAGAPVGPRDPQPVSERELVLKGEGGHVGSEPSSADKDSKQNEPGASEPAGEAKASEAAAIDDRTPEAKAAVEHDETRGVSLAHRIRQMNPNEKSRLAARGGRQERRLLLRDHTFSVQMGLLNNPRTEIKEVLEIAKNPQTTGGILKRLATDRKYTSNYEIQLALVKHPGTPTPLAIRLLDLLRISDLRTLAKSQALRENVRKAALRLYLQRSP